MSEQVHCSTGRSKYRTSRGIAYHRAVACVCCFCPGRPLFQTERTCVRREATTLLTHSIEFRTVLHGHDYGAQKFPPRPSEAATDSVDEIRGTNFGDLFASTELRRVVISKQLLRSSSTTTMSEVALFAVVAVASGARLYAARRQRSLRPTIRRTRKHENASKGNVQLRSRFRARQSAVRVVCCPTPREYLATIRNVTKIGTRVLVVSRHVDAQKSQSMQAAAESVGSSKLVFGYGGALWDVPALQRCGSPQVVCVEVGDVFGNDVVCDGLALVKLIRGVFGDTLKHVVVKSRNLARHSRLFLNAHRVTAGLLRERELAGRSWSGAGRAGTNDDMAIVVCAVGVRDYRHVIRHVVKPGDCVLEIGCALGKTTHLISIDGTGPSGRVIGIDNGKRCIDDARAQHDNRRKKAIAETGAAEEDHLNGRCEFEVADAWDTAELLRLSPFFNSIFVDVGGISGSDGELEVHTVVHNTARAPSLGPKTLAQGLLLHQPVLGRHLFLPVLLFLGIGSGSTTAVCVWSSPRRPEAARHSVEVSLFARPRQFMVAQRRHAAAWSAQLSNYSSSSAPQTKPSVHGGT